MTFTRRLIKGIFSLLITLCLLTSCEMDVNEFFEKYTETAAIMKMDIDGSYLKNSSDVTCFPSDDDHSITFCLRNPKNFDLEPRYTFYNPELAAEANDMTFVQDPNDKSIVRLTFKQGFLRGREELRSLENKDISGTVSFYEPMSGRIFDSYDVNLHANSAPPAVLNPCFQLSSSGADGKYIVCFYMPKVREVGNRTGATNPLHSDTYNFYVNGEHLYINDNTTDQKVYKTRTVGETSITYDDEDDRFTTTKPDMTSLQDGGFTFSESECPAEYFPLYFETGWTPDANNTTTCTLTITDDDGLSSSVSISNKAKQLTPPVFDIIDNTTYQADEDSGLYILHISHNGLCTDDTACGSGVTINYTITETDNKKVFVDGTLSTISGSARDMATISLPRGNYKISATVFKNYYITSEAAEVSGVKVRMPAVFYVREDGQDIDANGAKDVPYRTIQYAIDTFTAGIAAGEYEADSICDIRLLSDLTAPDDFNWNDNNGAFINTPESGFTGTLKISGWNGKYTIDLEGQNYSGFIINGATVNLEKLNLINNGGFIRVNSGTLIMKNVSSYNNITNTVIPGSLYILYLSSAECYDCSFTENISGDGAGAIYNNGTLYLENTTISKCYSNKYGAIQNIRNLTLKNVTINDCKGDEAGAIYNDVSFTLKFAGKNIIKDNTLTDGTTKSNIYLPYGEKITIDGNISGSQLGINIPFDETNKPTLNNNIVFTDGYDYPETNKQRPSEIFIAENGYGILPIDSGSYYGEAAFGISSGYVYTIEDYSFAPALAEGQTNTMYFDSEKTFTLDNKIGKRTIPGTIPDSVDLYYNPSTKTLYQSYNITNSTYSQPDPSGESIKITAALYNSGVLVKKLDLKGLNITIGKDDVATPGIYQLRITTNFLGTTIDKNIQIRINREAATVAEYISGLTNAGTYDVVVEGEVGAGENEGLAKVADAIKIHGSDTIPPDGVKINLDASRTNNSADLEAYNRAYFLGCKNLQSIKLPDWMYGIIPSLFEDCTSLNSVTLGDNINQIYARAFYGCSKLTSISLPKKLDEIEASAFVGCNNGKAISIIYEGTVDEWGKVKRPAQNVTPWHSGATEGSKTTGSVTCSDGRCGLDYTTD